MDNRNIAGKTNSGNTNRGRRNRNNINRSNTNRSNTKSDNSKTYGEKKSFGRYDDKETDRKYAGRKSFARHDDKETDRKYAGRKSFVRHDDKETDRKYAGRKSFVRHDDKETDRKYAGKKSSGKYNDRRRFDEETEKNCVYDRKCGGCKYINMDYQKQLMNKQSKVNELLSPFGKVLPIIGMKDPYHYRNKVHGVVATDKQGNGYTGIYEEKSHKVVGVPTCLIEDKKADEIMQSVAGLMKSFKMRAYNEDSGYGFLRHILIRVGHTTRQVMVVLVTASPVFPSKNNFVKALRKLHPEITTIVANVNNRNTSMVLGDKQQILYGKGYIEDILCGKTFRISPKSFYQVNSVQTEVLYKKAMEYAKLTGKEIVLDAYSGIGTIGMVASDKAKAVISVELNQAAVKDAIHNAKQNKIKNMQFYKADAGEFMVKMAAHQEKVDVVFMDPPRAGSDEKFMDSIAKLAPEKVVYISCSPETLARDLRYMEKKGYKVSKIQPVDMFPGTGHCESIVHLSRI